MLVPLCCRELLCVERGHRLLELPSEGDVDEEVDAAVDGEAEVVQAQQQPQPGGQAGAAGQGVLQFKMWHLERKKSIRLIMSQNKQFSLF